MKTLCRFLFVVLFIGAWIIAPVQAGVPTIEVSDGSKSLLQQSMEWKEITKWNKTYNDMALKELRDILDKLEGMRKTAKRMVNEINIDGLILLLDDPERSVLDFKLLTEYEQMLANPEALEDVAADSEVRQELEKLLEEVKLSSYVSMEGKVEIIHPLKQPIYKRVSPGSALTSGRDRTSKLLLRVSRKIKKNNQIDSYDLSQMLLRIAEDLLPVNALEKFDANKMASYVLRKIKITQIADGITLRPAVWQDYAFEEFANVNSNLTDEALFWSDPMVVRGYHPILGTVLNRTILYGYREIDMDNITTRGLSNALDIINRERSSRDQIKNPFKGYASTIVPGLVVMGEQGRLKPAETPTKDQLEEAQKLGRTLKMLPSQFFGSRAQKVSYSGSSNMKFSCLSASKVKFRYPRVILVDDGMGESQDVRLGKLDSKVFDNIMRMNKKRLVEIILLKKENERGRHYLEELINFYKDVEKETAALSQSMTHHESIPQITRLRKDIFSSMEMARWTLSDLHFEYDKLKQKEWEVLDNILETQITYVQKLMDTGALRLRIALEGQTDPNLK